MMGRSLYIIEGARIDMGSGDMIAKDSVVVPLGCSTPILLRAESRRNKYRYVGDIHQWVYEWRGGCSKEAIRSEQSVVPVHARLKTEELHHNWNLAVDRRNVTQTEKHFKILETISK